MPVTQLKKVVLPAPLGPMRATISPSRTWRSTALRARRPPKFIVIPFTSRTLCISRLRWFAAVLPRAELVDPPDVRHDPLRPENHHQDHRRSEQEHPVVAEGPEVFRGQDQDERPQDHADDRAHPAQDDN